MGDGWWMVDDERVVVAMGEREGPDQTAGKGRGSSGVAEARFEQTRRDLGGRAL